MDGNLWIVVPNWARFQHYSDRDPLWIKLYTTLGSDPDWHALTPGARGTLVTCWIEFARSDGRATLHQIATEFGAGWNRRYIEPLIDAGFIQLSASRPPRLSASPEKEKRRVDPQTPIASDGEKRTAANASDRGQPPSGVNRPPKDAAKRIAGLIANRIIEERFELEEELATADLPASLRAQLVAQFEAVHP